MVAATAFEAKLADIFVAAEEKLAARLAREKAKAENLQALTTSRLAYVFAEAIEHELEPSVDQALATYEGTVLAAYEEVDNGLIAWVNEQRRHEALIAAVESARRASELALVQYNSGLVDFQNVLTSDRQLISLEDALAVSDGEITANLIRLYKALGGGWLVYPTAATLAPLR